MSEKKCKHCAMLILPDAKICPYCRKKQGISTCMGIFIIIGILAFIGAIASNSSKPDRTPLNKDKAAVVDTAITYSNTPQTDRFNKMSPSEHLAEAQKALDEWKPNKDPMKTSWGRVNDAKKHLMAIPQNTPESAKKEKLLKEVLRREKEIQKAAKIVAEKVMIQQRKDFAKKYEMSLLDKGMDTAVSTLGKNYSILQIKWVLMNRPLVYKFINDEAAMSNLKKMGFKRIVFTDGYNKTWTSKID